MSINNQDKVLVVNIGNTNIRFGVFENDECQTSWVINTKPYRTRDEFYSQFKLFYQTYEVKAGDFSKIIIGSVVPQLTMIIRSALHKIHQLEPVLVDRATPSGVKHTSSQMGTDIYANLVAAHHLYPKEKKKLIIDFGTALTASCVDETGQVQGVIIAPGIITSLNALVGQTAQLPEIELVPPKNVLGNDTVSCMVSGMVYGYLGMVEGFIDRVNQEVGDDCFVIATGGVSHIYKPLTDKIHIGDRLHTLKGLYVLGK
ncbi:MAG: type III pantothenate kinase [Flavobacteriaceae bacterium]|nr:type III pantothenate kinase [Flavobacteriaceae bacterium]